jgi:hypothetical protein
MLVCYVAGFGVPAEAREAVKRAIGALEGDDVREAAAISIRARKGGSKVGPARAQTLTPEQRAEIARTAAAARWKKD